MLKSGCVVLQPQPLESFAASLDLWSLLTIRTNPPCSISLAEFDTNTPEQAWATAVCRPRPPMSPQRIPRSVTTDSVFALQLPEDAHCQGLVQFLLLSSLSIHARAVPGKKHGKTHSRRINRVCETLEPPNHLRCESSRYRPSNTSRLTTPSGFRTSILCLAAQARLSQEPLPKQRQKKKTKKAPAGALNIRPVAFLARLSGTPNKPTITLAFLSLDVPTLRHVDDCCVPKGRPNGAGTREQYGGVPLVVANIYLRNGLSPVYWSFRQCLILFFSIFVFVLASVPVLAVLCRYEALHTEF